MSDVRGEGPGASPRALDDRLPELAEALLVRHEERAQVRRRWFGLGSVRARTRVDRVPVDVVLGRDVEAAGLERVPASEDDSGRIETLPDGSISIPMFEEEVVVTKRVVLRERVILRKRVETVRARVQDELRVERLELDADEAVRDRLR